MRVLTAACALVLVACHGSGSGPSGPEVPRLPAEGDAVTLQQILDGALDPDEGLLRIARSGGLPIQTSQGFLFALRVDITEPYALSSPNGRFADVTTRTDRGVAWALVPVAEPAGARFLWRPRSGSNFQADPLCRHLRYVYPDPPAEPQNQIQLVRPDGAHLERWPGVGDAKIPARTIRVWVPAGPVARIMYAHDGKNLFDMVQPFGSWRLQDAAGPGTMIVGIDQSSDRFAEYTGVQDLGGQGGRGDDYADYVQHTVIPFVESRYGAAPVRGVMGSSLGGVISYHHALRYPGTFQLVASMSGTMGWGSIADGTHNPTPIDRFEALSACPAGTTFYLDSGGGPGAGCVDADADGIRDDASGSADNFCENAQLRDVLVALCGAQKVEYVWVEGAPHQEGAWRNRSPHLLSVFEGR